MRSTRRTTSVAFLCIMPPLAALLTLLSTWKVRTLPLYERKTRTGGSHCATQRSTEGRRRDCGSSRNGVEADYWNVRTTAKSRCTLPSNMVGDIDTRWMRFIIW